MIIFLKLFFSLSVIFSYHLESAGLPHINSFYSLEDAKKMCKKAAADNMIRYSKTSDLREFNLNDPHKKSTKSKLSLWMGLKTVASATTRSVRPTVTIPVGQKFIESKLPVEKQEHQQRLRSKFTGAATTPKTLTDLILSPLKKEAAKAPAKKEATADPAISRFCLLSNDDAGSDHEVEISTDTPSRAVPHRTKKKYKKKKQDFIFSEAQELEYSLRKKALDEKIQERIFANKVMEGRTLSQAQQDIDDASKIAVRIKHLYEAENVYAELYQICDLVESHLERGGMVSPAMEKALRSQIKDILSCKIDHRKNKHSHHYRALDMQHLMLQKIKDKLEKGHKIVF